jgi:hypothetical protein
MQVEEPSDGIATLRAIVMMMQEMEMAAIMVAVIAELQVVVVVVVVGLMIIHRMAAMEEAGIVQGEGSIWIMEQEVEWQVPVPLVM